MMTMIKKWTAVLFFLFFPLVTFAQEKDFGIWYGISLRHKVLKNLDVAFSPVLRTFKNASKIDQEFLEAGLEYKFNKHLSTMGSYRLTNSIEDDARFHIQHKLFIDLKGSMALSAFNINCRMRFQSRVKTYIENDKDKIPDYTGRIKLKASFKTPNFPVDPYIYAETFSPLFIKKERVIEKSRLAAGIQLSIANRHSVEVEYIFQRDYLPNISDINVISIVYSIEL